MIDMKASPESVCQEGDRIECGGYLGTVKYVGSIEGKEFVWLGIDWDDPTRGKHNGNLNGNQYFTTKYPKSGSFVRPEKVQFGKSALASIESRYGQVEDDFTAKINQQKKLLRQQDMNAPFLEMVGFDKVFKMQSDFNSLKIINLRNQTVKSAGPSLKLNEICPNIEELDISKNLFVSWLEVLEICMQLKKLHWLNVSENLLLLPDILPHETYPNLKTLICGSMRLCWSDVERIVRLFPELNEFRVPHNRIKSLNEVVGLFDKLVLFDIEGNAIESWSEICKLNPAPNLEYLIIENINLASIYFEGDESKVTILKKIRKLCITNNKISEWTSIGELNRLEQLDNLKFSKNPITESEESNTVHQIIIAKIANLKILNGVEIEPGERRGAEYDYIKKYGLEWLSVKGTEQETHFLKNHNRYVELIHMYGEPEKSELRAKPKLIKSSLIELNLVYDDYTVMKRLPPTLTVQKLKMMTQKIFSLNDRPQLQYISSADSQIHVDLDDEMKEIGLYSMQDGDQITVRA